jgi:ABC-type uncharacterized transport system substrate-binding protein
LRDLRRRLLHGGGHDIEQEGPVRLPFDLTKLEAQEKNRVQRDGKQHTRDENGSAASGARLLVSTAPRQNCGSESAAEGDLGKGQFGCVHVVLRPAGWYTWKTVHIQDQGEAMRILLLSFLVMLTHAAAAFSEPIIGIIHSYHKEYSWEQNLTQGLLQSLPREADIRHFFLDTKRTPRTEHAARADKVWQDISGTRWTLVVLCDDNAARLLGPRLLRADFPVVYVGINGNPRDYGLYPAPNMTGVLERPLLKRSLLSMCRLVNTDDTKVLILFDSDATSDAVVQEAFEGRSSLNLGKVRVDLKQFSAADKWRTALLNARTDGYDTVYIGLFHTLRDANGAHVPEDEVLAWANANTPVPIFAFWDFAVGKGKTIGGHVLSAFDQGAEAGEIACRILSGTPPSAILPKTAQAGTYRFSEHELKRFGIELPPAIRQEAVMVP